MKRNVKITWHLNRGCNFNCSYCYVRNMKNKMSMLGHDWKEDLAAFKRIHNKYGIECITLSGGEPFVYPNFVELCEGITKFTSIYINSNCSTNNVYEFADKINPKKVKEIHISLHLGERKGYGELVDKIHYLISKGFNVYLSQVMHPNLIGAFKNAREFFLEEGIELNPKVFEGEYHFKEYPNAYSKKDREYILEVAHECGVSQRQSHFRSMVHGQLSWEGHICNYGYDGMIIKYNGDAYRCHGCTTYLGNLYEGDIELFDKAERCVFPICKCEAEGWEGTNDECPMVCKQSIKRIAHPYILKYGRKIKEKLGYFKTHL